MSWLLTALVLILVLTSLVAVHELGHYLFARLFGMAAEEFAIGMGRPKFTYRKSKYAIAVRPGEYLVHPEATTDPSGLPPNPSQEGAPYRTLNVNSPDRFPVETEFTLRALPIGGFVRIRGMEPFSDGSETKILGGFFSRPAWQRFIVLLAGPVFSVIFGVLALTGVMWVRGKYVASNAPIVRMVQDGSGAQKAGIEAGDRIVAVNGSKISTMYQVICDVRDQLTRPIHITVRRASAVKTVAVKPTIGSTPVVGPNLEPTGQLKEQARLGIGFEVREPISLAAAAVEGLDVPVEIVGGIVNDLFHPKKLSNDVGGPVGIAVEAQQATSDGISAIIIFGGFLSVSVGICNLLPFVPLDGGQLAITTIEILRGGRRLSFNMQMRALQVGFALICMLVIGVTFLDVRRLSGSPNLAHSSLRAKSGAVKAKSIR